MLKNLIILPDGTEIFSGNSRGNAIISCKYTQCVNDGTELTIGSVCSNELELKLFTTGGLKIAAGDEIQYYKVDDSGERTKIGVFCCERPTVTGSGTYKFVAYDNISKLDKDLTDWLAGLDGWPYTPATFASMVCTACGVQLATGISTNDRYKIRKFSGSGVTGRMLMRWIGQIQCCFIQANVAGNIELAWYSNKGTEITASGEHAYFGGGLSYEDYQVAEIQKVQIQSSDEDNGTVYPDGNEEALNTYKISGNYLLTAETAGELKPVAQSIFERLQDITYTPCKVSIPATTAINAGDVVRITDANGVTISAFVMQKSNKGQRDTLECTGSPRRDSTTATNELTLKAINGKVLNISKSVEGLRIENADTAGNVTKLQQTVGQVSVSATSSSGTLATTINNDGTWKSEFTNASGDTVSGIYFDFTKKQFVFNGQITADSGTIAGWHITAGKLYAGGVIDDEDTGLPGMAIATPSAKGVYVLAAGGTDHTSYSPNNGWMFAVNKAGTVYCKDLRLSGGKININDRFMVSANGDVTLPDNATISWGQITDTDDVATQTYVKGLGFQTASQVTTITKNTITTEYVNALNITAKKLAATTGTIGGWSLTSGKLYAGDGSTVKTVVMQAPTADNSYVFAAGGASHSNYGDCPFRVTKTGKLYASSAEIAGKLTSGVGSKIGGFAVDSNSLYNGTWGSTAPDVFISTGTANEYLIGGKTTSGWAIGCGGNFGVTNKGYMYCNAARVGAWDLTTSYLNGTGSASGVGVKLYADKLAFVASDGTETAVTWEKLVKGAV